MPRMTVADVIDRRKAIEDMARDYEVAHGEEDRLHLEVLEAIAAGTCEQPELCAAVAVTTQLIPFARHCA